LRPTGKEDLPGAKRARVVQVVVELQHRHASYKDWLSRELL
jgi:hypothetical protein